MKKLLLIAALMISSLAFSQIKVLEKKPTTEIGKISPMGNLVISLDKSDEDYIFTYRDVKFQHLNEYKTFTFKETGSDLDQLYDIIMKGIEEQPSDNIYIDIPEGVLILKFGKILGSKNVEIGHSLNKNGDVIGFSRTLTKRDINKLFNRK